MRTSSLSAVLLQAASINFTNDRKTQRMNREETYYLLPYLLSLAVTLGVFVYTWRHRHVRHARIYSWFVGGQVLTVFGFILELISPNLQTKLLWDKFQWFTDIFLVVLPFLIFSLQFSEYKLSNPKLTWTYWLGLPILFTLVLLTDDVHHLLYPNPHLSADIPFPELKYDFTYVVYGFSLVYVYGANFYGIGLLIQRAVQPFNAYRLQYWTVAIGFLIPLLATIFTLVGIRIAPQRDLAPFSFAVGNLVVAWGLFRYRLFDLVPIARERVLEIMADSIFVLDATNKVVDVNQTALKNLGRASAQVVGRPADIVFTEWPDLVKQTRNLENATLEVSGNVRGRPSVYELNVSSIHDRRKRLLGRVFVAHDITRRKILEDGYRYLSEELEERVRERTEDLRESTERYRALFEQTHDAIFILDFEGRHIEINQRAADMLGYTREETLKLSMREISAELTQSEQVLGRLLNGETIPLYERMFRKKNGDLIPVEINVELVRDRNGKPLHIQSVVRDITKRKQAEDALRGQLAFEELMTRLLTRFATCSSIEVDASIDAALQEITEFLGGDFSDILLLSEDGKAWSPVHRWDNPHRIQSFHDTRSIQTKTLIWTENKLLKGEPIRISSLDDYPAEAVADRQFGAEEGIKSLLSVPIRGRKLSVVGVIDVVCYYRQITWTDKDVAHLQLIGDAITNLLERKRAEENLAEAYDITLEGWAKALELRDKETEGHSRRVTETTLTVARAMGIPEEEMDHIRRGTLLHDIGKMGIPDDILRKKGSLTEEELAVVRLHPETAFKLLKPIPYLEKALVIPYCHHEKWDGSGYPQRLRGEAIPLAARIFAVVDVWDALSFDRPYRSAWPQERIVQYLRDEAGKHFDPNIVETFLDLLDHGKF